MGDGNRLLEQRTVVEPLNDSVAEELLSALLESRAELCRTMSWDCWDADAVQGFLDRSAQERAAGRGRQFVIREQGSGVLAGIIGLKDFDPFTPKAEVGYWIRTSLTGRGYATDAVGVIVEYCRDELALTRLDAVVADFNAASQKVLLNNGFAKEGFKPRAQLCHGRWLDLVLFGRLLDQSG